MAVYGVNTPLFGYRESEIAVCIQYWVQSLIAKYSRIA